MKLLVVEDDLKIKTEVIDDVLASLGYASDWATNQQDAIALLAENDYDLVLLGPADPIPAAGDAEC